MPNLNNYALALFNESLEQKNILPIFNDFSVFTTIIKENEEWLTYTTQVDKSIANQNIDALGFNETFSAFLKILVKDRLLKELLKVKKIFFKYVDAHLKQAYVEVLISKNISERQKIHLNKKINTLFNERKVIITYKVDPSLISGYKIYYLGGELDMTINARLEKLFFNL